MKVDIFIEGFSHDGMTWPACRIMVDDVECLTKDIQGLQHVSFEAELDPASHHSIKILQINKAFGENRVWHTKVVDGETLDRYMNIVDIKFDEVSIKKIWHNGIIKNEFNERQINDFKSAGISVPDEVTVPQGYSEIRLSYNGGYELEFTTPVYDWIILKQSPLMKIEGKMKESSLTSIVTWRLDYTSGNSLAKLYDECKELLEKVK